MEAQPEVNCDHCWGESYSEFEIVHIEHEAKDLLKIRAAEAVQ